MSNFQTSEDLLKGALFEAGEVDNGNSPLQAKALEHLNASYLNILAGSNEFDVDCGEPWEWAREEYPETFVLKLPYETGTVTLTKGSANGTFSSPPSESMVDRHLKIDGRPEYFIIKTHVGGNANFTIDVEYPDSSGTLAFKAIKLIYTLSPNILRFVEPFRIYRSQDDIYTNGKISSMDTISFRNTYPLTKLTSGQPDVFTILKQDGSTFKIQFNRYVINDQAKVEFDYIKLPSALTNSSSSIPLIPPQHRVVLMYMTAALLLNGKDDKKAAGLGAMAKNKMIAMVKERKKGQRQTNRDAGRIIPRRDRYTKEGYVLY